MDGSLAIQTVYDNEKVLKASDQRDIVWFVSSACYLRRQWPECFGRAKTTFCFTRAIDVLQGESFFFVVKKHLFG